MKLIYTAGPYRSESEFGIYLNIRKAEKVAMRLWKEGWCVLCPHLNTQLFDGVVPAEAFLKGGLLMLSKCDAIYMMKDFRASRGAKKELKLAKKLGLEIIYEGEDAI